MDGQIDQSCPSRIIRSLREIKKDKRVKAVVLRVDSPGGSVVSSEAILEEVKLLDKVRTFSSLPTVPLGVGFAPQESHGCIFTAFSFSTQRSARRMFDVKCRCQRRILHLDELGKDIRQSDDIQKKHQANGPGLLRVLQGHSSRRTVPLGRRRRRGRVETRLDRRSSEGGGPRRCPRRIGPRNILREEGPCDDGAGRGRPLSEKILPVGRTPFEWRVMVTRRCCSRIIHDANGVRRDGGKELQQGEKFLGELPEMKFAKMPYFMLTMDEETAIDVIMKGD